MGGASIFRVKEGDPNIGVIAETLTELGNRRRAQNYLPAIKDGDKRVLGRRRRAGALTARQRVFRRAAKPAATSRLAVGEPRPLSESDGKCPPRWADAKAKGAYIFTVWLSATA